MCPSVKLNETSARKEKRDDNSIVTVKGIKVLFFCRIYCESKDGRKKRLYHVMYISDNFVYDHRVARVKVVQSSFFSSSDA